MQNVFQLHRYYNQQIRGGMVSCQEKTLRAFLSRGFLSLSISACKDETFPLHFKTSTQNQPLK